MVPFAYKNFRKKGADALADASFSPQRLVLIHTAAALGLSLILNILHYVLQQGIAGTGGLSGIGTRTVLEFIQTVLQIVNLVVLPFWNIGYLYTTLLLSRRQDVSQGTLLEGFRCWGPVLRTLILRLLALFIAAFLGGQAGAVVFMASPAGLPFMEMFQGMDMTTTPDYAALLEDPAFMAAMEPMIPWVAVGAVVLMIPVFYLTRFMRFAVMDQPDRGAFPALFQSIRFTFRNLGKLLLLDLRFWWYYLLEVLTLVIGYGDLLLPLAGLQLPMQEDVAMFLFYGISLLAQLCLYVWAKNGVFVTYAQAYDWLKAMPKATPSRPVPPAQVYTPPQQPQQPQPPQQPQKPQSSGPSGPVPWKY